jgi:hypothetical protein
LALTLVGVALEAGVIAKKKSSRWERPPRLSGQPLVQFIPLAPPVVLPVLQQPSFGAPQVVHL